MNLIKTVGKRKTSIARVFMSQGEGKMTFNGDRNIEDYFPREAHRRAVMAPLNLVDRATSYDFKVNVIGGGPTGQAEAVRHGIARALLAAEADLRGALKEQGLLTRDPRIVESKKYGHHKARRSCQFSKR